MDGDVDFGPDSVRMLVDRMKKNKKVGAASGRIHPIGSGMHCLISLGLNQKYF
jgi:chitin synthase